MGNEDESLTRLFELVGSNTARIEGLEDELSRTRGTVHEVRAEAAAVRFLAQNVAELAGDVRNLAQRVEKIAHHAVGRPSTASLGVLGQYVALVVAIIALVFASRH